MRIDIKNIALEDLDDLPAKERIVTDKKVKNKDENSTETDKYRKKRGKNKDEINALF